MTTSVSLDPAARNPASATQTGQLTQVELRRGDVLGGRFRIEALLGVGGFGFVYRARDLSLDIDVAIKLLRPELARRPEAFERFRQELLLARQVSNPHVVRIHDIARHDERWFISMDFVDGESLEQRLDRSAPLPLEEALAITRGLLAGLGAAHDCGVVHRDLKPANILLDAGGKAYVTDFGVARSIGATGMTQSGVLVGTPEYLSPEQARGEKVDARSDLYAVGLMLYEMLCGEAPFSGGTPAETVMRRIVAAPPALARARADLPRWLHAFCDRLLKTDPAQRFADAHAALHALDTQSVPRAPLSRRSLALAVAGVALALATAAAYIAFENARDAGAPAVAAAVARVALLPLQADEADEAQALARALDEHALAWLRDDAAHPAVPRRRVLDALARQTPGLADAALLRQLPDVARAAAATYVVHGTLRRAGKGYVLQLALWSDGAASEAQARAETADVAELEARFESMLAELLAGAGLHPGAAPPLAVAALAPLGRGLLERERDDAAAASRELAVAASADPRSAPVAAALLDAQQAAHEDLSLQATRERIAREFAGARGALGRELHARALLDAERGDEALRELEAAHAAFPEDAALALLYAQALIDAGNGARALAVLRHCVTVDSEDARAWFVLGRTAIQQGEAEVAVSDYLTHALVLNRLRGDRAAEAESLNALGVGYERLGRLDAAAAQYEQAAALREKLGDETNLAKSLRNLAIVQAVRGDAANADHTLERVRQLLEKNGDRASLADLYNDRGVVAEEHGAYAQALGFYRKALALRQELNLPGPLADSLNNVGFASYSLGDFDNALVFWQQALAQYQTVDDRNGALRIDESIGLLDIARGHFDAARQRLTAALQNAEDHQLSEEAAVAHTYLGQLALDEGRYVDAQASAQRAAAIFRERADQRGAAESALLEANVALALGDAAAAQTAVAALDPARLSTDQQAMLKLAGAQRARLAGDSDGALQNLAAAAGLVDAHSSVGLRVGIENAREHLARNDVAGADKLLHALRGETVLLADVPVRLQWLEIETALALRSGRGAEAAAHYRDALALLRGVGRWADAVSLHRLGAQALAGTPAEARAAQQAADAVQAQLVAAAPAAARPGLERALALRWDAESGESHGH